MAEQPEPSFELAELRKYYVFAWAAGIGLYCVLLASVVAKLATLGFIDIIYLVFLAGVPIVVVFFSFPRMAVIAVILFAQIQYTFTTINDYLFPRVLPMSFQWGDEPILVALLAALVFGRIVKGRSLHSTPINKPFFLFCFFTVASIIINMNPFLQSVYGLKYVFQMIILYFAIVNMDFDEKFLRKLRNLILGIAIFQAVFGTFGFGVNFKLFVMGNRDVFHGTWGGGSSNKLGLFFLMMSCFMLGQLKYKFRMKYMVLTGMFMFCLVLTSARIAILLTPIALGLVLRKRLFKDFATVVRFAMILIVLLVGLYYYYIYNTPEEVRVELSPQSIWMNLSQRLSYIPVVLDIQRTYSDFWPIGTGVGTYGIGGAWFQSPIQEEVSELMWLGIINPTAWTGSSVASVFVEHGPVGLLLMFYMLIKLWFFSLRAEKAETDPYWKGYYAGLAGVLFLNIATAMIEGPWHSYLQNTYLWFFAGIACRHWVLRKTMAETEASAAEAAGETGF